MCVGESHCSMSLLIDGWGCPCTFSEKSWVVMSSTRASS